MALQNKYDFDIKITMKQKIYIETSVVSYLTGRPSKDIIIAGHQVSTRDFWELLPNFDAFISELVLEEAGQGDKTASEVRLRELEGFQELEISEQCGNLASTLISDGVIPSQYPEDALHIAVAAVHGINIIVTWNFKHINNPVTRYRIRESVERQGYCCPEMCSPDEFLGDTYD